VRGAAFSLRHFTFRVAAEQATLARRRQSFDAPIAQERDNEG
jgi:hypothetical protein